MIALFEPGCFALNIFGRKGGREEGRKEIELYICGSHRLLALTMNSNYTATKMWETN